MKVPTYQASTRLTPETGAGQLRVQASGQALAAPFRAQAQFASAANRIATDYIAQEQENRRNQIINDALITSATSLQDTTSTAMSQQSPDDMVSFFDNGVQQIQDRLAGIDDRTMSELGPRLSQQIASARLNVIKMARNRSIEIQKATALELVDTLQIQMASGNSVQQTQASDLLFGTYDQDGQLIRPGVIEQGLQSGLFTGDEAAALRKDSESTIPELVARNQFATADQNSDPEGAAEVVARLRNPKEFVGLDSEQRTKLIEQGVDLEQQLISRIGRVQDKKDRDGDLAIKKTQDSTYSNMLTRIFDEDPNDQPGLLEINTALGAAELRPTQAEALRNIVNDLDAPRRDPTVISSIFSDISAAETPAEIDDIVGRVSQNMGKDGSIPLNDAMSLLRFADQAKENTPLQREIRKYESFLKTYTGGPADSFLPVDQRQRQADALETYYRLTSDPAQPLPPKEAYDLISAQYDQVKQETFGFVGLSPNVRKAVGFEKAVSDYTLEDFETARAFVRQEKGMSQLQKAIEFETLDLLKTEVERTQKDLMTAEQLANLEDKLRKPE